jgi:hypothetical protein
MSRRSQARLEAEINRRTDNAFWQLTGRPRGQRLDRRIAADRALIDTWLDIRYRVAQMVAIENNESVDGVA